MTAPTTTHTIAPGECISTLAERTGLPVATIWNDPGNAGLREAGRDPNILAAGDEVCLPAPSPRSFEVAADDTYYFQVKRPRAVFRLRLQRNGEPLADEAYVLTTQGRTFEGTADDAGHIEVVVPAGSTHATLLLPGRGEQYELRLGHLGPADHWQGAAQRLQNLGLYSGALPGAQEQVQGALRLFQALHKLEATGTLDERTISALREAHGC